MTKQDAQQTKDDQQTTDGSNESGTSGEALAEEIREIRELDRSAQDPTDGRGMPGDGSAGATGPGGSSS